MAWTQETCNHPLPAATRGPGAFALLRAMFAARRQRKTLKELDADALRDIGLSTDEAEAEARRPMWDVPQNWRI